MTSKFYTGDVLWWCVQGRFQPLSPLARCTYICKSNCNRLLNRTILSVMLLQISLKGFLTCKRIYFGDIMSISDWSHCNYVRSVCRDVIRDSRVKPCGKTWPFNILVSTLSPFSRQDNRPIHQLCLSLSIKTLYFIKRF